MSDQSTDFADLNALVRHMRKKLNNKNYILMFAYNGVGKTRLSMAFKEAGKNGGTEEEEKRDTLYFNAFTEDLFSWDNDLENDAERVLKLNSKSKFFSGLQDVEMDNRIRPLLQRYADFDFKINTDDWTVSFEREIVKGESSEMVEHIKVSRGEENIFIWCFFLAVAQLAIDEQEAYSWVKYIYIDDPISSLDDNNAIAVASHLAQLLNDQGRIKVVISSHHTLFFNVMCNALKKPKKYFLCKDEATRMYLLKNTGDTPFFHHVALLRQLHDAKESGQLYTYHFNMLRNILEKTASFHGFNNFSACIKQDKGESDDIVHARLINLLSHGDYSLFEPREMLKDTKDSFIKILDDFMKNYRFNPELFPEKEEQESEEATS
ncbi:MAG: AAA family ATPase [Candidatus Nitrohelix vancouverensis]|uniref:AAA family ATPase n=1 Tax=Candidatus Nitrohelix vancouverensis TaxID=2705534 RepID=A0A7T0C1E7_9BACT|nr:MAG: AAA family ATPase [Candidatus Nitrohelix vancouverensis]